MTTKDDVKEEIRQDIKPQLRRTIKASGDIAKLARHVDEQPLDKMVISSYSEYESNIKRTVGDDPAVEKNRARYGVGYHPAEVPLSSPFQKIYFDLMGQGINGTASPSTLKEEYVCPGCGLRFAQSMKLMALTCPVCGRLTPRGRLTKEIPDWYKR